MKNCLFKKIIIITLFIFVLGISIALTKTKPNEILYVGPSRDIGLEYFSVDPSQKLIYDSNFGEALSIIEKKGNDYILDMRNDDFFFIQTVQVINDTVYITKLDENVDVFLFISAGVEVSYERPSIRFPFPLTVNDSWQWTGVELIDGENPDTINISGKVLGNEIVSTEAGDFDCVKFQIDINKKKSGPHTKFYEWRTPEIGLVKLEAYIDSKGFIGTIMDLLGYDEMNFILKKVI
ncbi:MAG: hypothetical protein OQK52_10520 [Ignavibacteriaceae bacterium]|jgi:hypothetical protein|nr:hypothetical protein [Ignavibacteriaceae bacterium]MCW8818296.1 hypothetical protein [Ignavibacteriaceae bacterium]MCW8823856.1 hypothetical protein [Ignavibacteriaceae bacterium]MCW8961718.1 hypothetical protein [Ignavibacteriaceae bacterium]